MPKISGLHLSRAGAVIGSILLVLGIALAVDIPAGLIAAGLLLLVGSLLFIETEDKKERRK